MIWLNFWKTLWNEACMYRRNFKSFGWVEFEIPNKQCCWEIGRIINHLEFGLTYIWNAVICSLINFYVLCSFVSSSVTGCCFSRLFPLDNFWFLFLGLKNLTPTLIMLALALASISTPLCILLSIWFMLLTTEKVWMVQSTAILFHIWLVEMVYLLVTVYRFLQWLRRHLQQPL